MLYMTLNKECVGERHQRVTHELSARPPVSIPGRGIEECIEAIGVIGAICGGYCGMVGGTGVTDDIPYRESWDHIGSGFTEESWREVSLSWLSLDYFSGNRKKTHSEHSCKLAVAVGTAECPACTADVVAAGESEAFRGTSEGRPDTAPEGSSAAG